MGFLQSMIALVVAVAAAAQETVLVGPNGSLKFDPIKLNIGAGTEVTFVQGETGVPHNVYFTQAPDGVDVTKISQTSDYLSKKGQTFVMTLDKPGTYNYICTFHSEQNMYGQIEVSVATPAATPSPPPPSSPPDVSPPAVTPSGASPPDASSPPPPVAVDPSPPDVSSASTPPAATPPPGTTPQAQESATIASPPPQASAASGASLGAIIVGAIGLALGALSLT